MISTLSTVFQSCYICVLTAQEQSLKQNQTKRSQWQQNANKKWNEMEYSAFRQPWDASYLRISKIRTKRCKKGRNYSTLRERRNSLEAKIHLCRQWRARPTSGTVKGASLQGMEMAGYYSE